MSERPRIWGLLAEFADPNELVEAARRVRHEGYRRIDAYSPFPIEELSEAMQGRVRALHDRWQIEYRYAEWRELLALFV